MSYSEYRSAIMHMQKRNRKITCYDLKPEVTVLHSDGSCFFFNYALIELYKDRYLIVYSEHQQPMLFFQEDLEFAGYGKGVEAIKNNVLTGWWIYMVPGHRYVSGITQDTSKEGIRYLSRSMDEEQAKVGLSNIRKLNMTEKHDTMLHFLSSIPVGKGM